MFKAAKVMLSDSFEIIGLMIGALLAALLMQPLRLIPSGWHLLPVAVILYAGLMFGGARAGKKYRIRNTANPHTDELSMFHSAIPKLLDTSVLIDGRIYDIIKSGFLEGELIVPGFVLSELRHIADSTDAIRRNRGRRGLDVISRIQAELQRDVRIEEKDFDDLEEVDVKLLRLTKELDGAVMTNDYNLNKVAGVSGVKVLNINELSAALRPVVLPGEEMCVQVIREGKEPGQGVAYLEDGTMVVVESGRRHLGETLDVVVTTVLQTNAGRMIFTKMKSQATRAC